MNLIKYSINLKYCEKLKCDPKFGYYMESGMSTHFKYKEMLQNTGTREIFTSSFLYILVYIYYNAEFLLKIKKRTETEIKMKTKVKTKQNKTKNKETNKQNKTKQNTF